MFIVKQIAEDCITLAAEIDKQILQLSPEIRVAAQKLYDRILAISKEIES